MLTRTLAVIAALLAAHACIAAAGVEGHISGTRGPNGWLRKVGAFPADASQLFEAVSRLTQDGGAGRSMRRLHVAVESSQQTSGGASSAQLTIGSGSAAASASASAGGASASGQLPASRRGGWLSVLGLGDLRQPAAKLAAAEEPHWVTINGVRRDAAAEGWEYVDGDFVERSAPGEGALKDSRSGLQQLLVRRHLRSQAQSAAEFAASRAAAWDQIIFGDEK